MDESKLGPIIAMGGHSALGRFEAKVEDLSSYGMALVVPSAATAFVLTGERLDALRVFAGGVTLYEGSAIVRRAADRHGSLVLGVELSAGGLDLAEFYRVSERHSFAERLLRMERESHDQQVSPRFKTWVADLRTYLETMQEFLDAEEKALSDLDLLTRQQMLAEYLNEAARAVVERMSKAAVDLGFLVRDLSGEDHSVHRAFLRKHVLSFITRSPLLRRAYEKPLGYAGDYEVMNMLYRDHAEGDSLFAKALNIFGAQEAAARANINRVSYLGTAIRRAIETSSRPRIRVASIGCGPGQELMQLLREHPELGPRLDVALIDQEERAITYCERTLGPVGAACGARFDFIKESVRRLLTERQLETALGARDLIYSAGLFDYLSSRTFAALLAALYDGLVPGGSLIAGNVASDNPTRWFMEYCLDWFLIHRSPQELMELAQSLVPLPRSAKVDAETLGVNLFLIIQR